LKLLESVEKEGFHLTLNYFWVQMLTYQIISVYRLEGGVGGLDKKCFGAMTNTGQDQQTHVVVSQGGDTSNANVRIAETRLVASMLQYALRFHDFMKRECVQQCSLMCDSLLYEAYYSHEVIDSDVAKHSLQLPDKQNFPSCV
jgi:hypothetical protein